MSGSGKEAPAQGGAAKTERKRPPITAFAAAAEELFGLKVDKVTAPGGSFRESLRIHFEGGGRAIATWRKEVVRQDREYAVLEALSQTEAPVPKLLGRVGDIYFQQDLGSTRFAAELRRRDAQGQEALAAEAFTALFRIQDAAESLRLAERLRLPAVAIRDSWYADTFALIDEVSSFLGIAPAPIDRDAYKATLASRAPRFVKWDARPGNAAVLADGSVAWFDFEHCGRREGIEDPGWLAADEYWTLGPEPTLRALDATAPAALRRRGEDFFTAFVCLQAWRRVQLIVDRLERKGWIDPADAMRHDKIGAAPEFLDALCAHGAAWAERSAVTRPLAAWFAAVPAAARAKVPLDRVS